MADNVLLKRMTPTGDVVEEKLAGNKSVDEKIIECNHNIERIYQEIDNIETQIDKINAEIKKLEASKQDCETKVYEFEQEKIIWERKLRRFRRQKGL